MPDPQRYVNIGKRIIYSMEQNLNPGLRKTGRKKSICVA
jgi:hypothetical protein